jgi:glyoxylase-like metal-dependent hydrolase (beta-lactamase superfamily II)
MLQHTVDTPYMVGEVHFYSTELDGALALFDTGPPTAQGEDVLRESVDLDRLKYLLITHCHVDHYGLASYVLENSSACVYFPRLDAVKFARHAERLACIGGLLGEYGFGEAFLRQLRDSYARHKIFPRIPERYRIVEESAELKEAGVAWLACPGHSQSDLVYLVGGCAISGDLLLKNIFQAPLLDIDLDTFAGRFRNYDAYCASLGKLVQLRGLQIMPGHRESVGVDDAIVFYVTTLLERSVKLLPLRGLAVNLIVERLFQGRLTDPFQVYLKVSEIVFMLDFLENPARLRSSLESIGLFRDLAELYHTVISS